MGILRRSTLLSRSNLISLSARSITVRVLRPRKSNLINPVFSVYFMSNWVRISLFGPMHTGRYSTMGRGEMTTPAAWVDLCRDSPSSVCEMDSSRRMSSSFMASRSRGSASMAFFRVIFSSSGTSLAMRSTSGRGMSSTRPTSRSTARAFIDP